jgi:hypothetical protein
MPTFTRTDDRGVMCGTVRSTLFHAVRAHHVAAEPHRRGIMFINVCRFVTVL